MLFQLLLFVYGMTRARSRHLNGAGDIPLFIRTHSEETHALEVPSDSTVGDVVQAARDAGFILETSKLSFGDQPLNFDEMLQDVGIGNEAMLIEVLMKIPNQFLGTSEKFEILDNGNRIKLNAFFNESGDVDTPVQILSEIGTRKIKLKVLNDGGLGVYAVGFGYFYGNYNRGDVVTLNIEDNGSCSMLCDGKPAHATPDLVDQTPRNDFVGELPLRLECMFKIRWASNGVELEFID